MEFHFRDLVVEFDEMFAHVEEAIREMRLMNSFPIAKMNDSTRSYFYRPRANLWVKNVLALDLQSGKLFLARR